MRISRRNVGLEVVVAMRELITFPLFLGILAVSVGQVQCAFLFLVFRVEFKRARKVR